MSADRYTAANIGVIQRTLSHGSDFGTEDSQFSMDNPFDTVTPGTGIGGVSAAAGSMSPAIKIEPVGQHSREVIPEVEFKALLENLSTDR